MQARTDSPVGQRERRARAARAYARPDGATRVSVAWNTANDSVGHAGETTEVELIAGQRSGEGTSWTCEHPVNCRWLDALTSAHSTEVVLTARSDEATAKHLVLELAELLTFKLAATQPVVRVRFPPTG